MTAPARVMVVALDAADKDLLLEWAAAGRLPAFRDLLAASAWGITLGPLGMHAAAVWHSFATAVSPARHGRHADRQIEPGTYALRRFWPTDLKHEPFWVALNRTGNRLAVIDVPYLPLCTGLKGVQIVDWTSHAADTGFCTWPPELAAEVRHRFGDDAIGLCDHLRIRSRDEVAAFRDALTARVRQKTALSRHLLAQGGWDLFVTAFGDSHCIGHHGWHVHDPRHPLHDDAVRRALGDPLVDVYQALDAAIATLVADAGSDAVVFVVSTHGIGANYHGAHLLGEVLWRLGHGPPSSDRSRPWTVVRRAWRALPARVRSHLIPLQKATVDRTWPVLDRHHACFDVPNGEVWGAIRVNLVGREPDGRIAPGADLDAFCDRLREELGAVINVDTGQPAIRRVLRTRDLYAGPYLDHLPDLLVEWNADAPLRTIASPRLGTIRRPFDNPRTGHHKREGIVLVRGPGIRPGRLPEPVSIMDVAPTIAAHLGTALPDVDGRPVAAWLP